MMLFPDMPQWIEPLGLGRNNGWIMTITSKNRFDFM